MTAILGVIIIYLYALIGFYFLDSNYFDYNQGDGSRSCMDLLHCYMNTQSFGLRVGGGIGEFLK